MTNPPGQVAADQRVSDGLCYDPAARAIAQASTSTPQVCAPWEPPPWRARLTALTGCPVAAAFRAASRGARLIQQSICGRSISWRPKGRILLTKTYSIGSRRGRRFVRHPIHQIGGYRSPGVAISNS